MQEYLSDNNDYAALQAALAAHPEAGDHSRVGWVRKLRWGGSGRGKRGCLRVIYHMRPRPGEIWMLTLYAKNEAESIPGHVLKIREEIDGA